MRDDTVFYFYGESYGEMRKRLARVLKTADMYGDARSAASPDREKKSQDTAIYSRLTSG